MNESASVNWERTGLRRAWRFAALIALFVWVSAFGICTAHCALGKRAHIGGGKSESLPPCHGGPVSPDSGSDSKTATSFCFTIKSLFSGVSNLTVETPDAPAFLQPVFAVLSAPDSALAPVLAVLRQSHLPDRVFTPEVYLGPAFYSHAPPASSLN